MTRFTTLRPVGPSRSRLRLLPLVSRSRATSAVQAEYGTYDTLAGQRLLADFGYVDVPLSLTHGVVDFNMPPGQPALPDVLAFSSACSTGVRGTFIDTDESVPGQGAASYFMGLYTNIAAGRWGDGVSYDNTGRAGASSAFAAWIHISG